MAASSSLGIKPPLPRSEASSSSSSSRGATSAASSCSSSAPSTAYIGVLSTSTSSTSVPSLTADTFLDAIDIDLYKEHQKILHHLLRAKIVVDSFFGHKYEDLLNNIDTLMETPALRILAHGNLTKMLTDSLALKDSPMRRKARMQLKTLAGYSQGVHDYLKEVKTFTKEILEVIQSEPVYRMQRDKPIGPENPIQTKILDFLNPDHSKKITKDQLSEWLFLLFRCKDGEKSKSLFTRDSDYLNFVASTKLFYVLHQEDSYIVVRVDDPLSIRNQFFSDFHIITTDEFARPVEIASVLKQPRNLKAEHPQNIEAKLNLFPMDRYWIGYQPLSFDPNSSDDIQVPDFSIVSNALQLYQIEMGSDGRLVFQPQGRPLFSPYFLGQVKKLTIENDSRLFFIANTDLIGSGTFQVFEIQVLEEFSQLIPHFSFMPKIKNLTDYQILNGVFAGINYMNAYMTFLKLEDIASGSQSECLIEGHDIYRMDQLDFNVSSASNKISIYRSDVKGEEKKISTCSSPQRLEIDFKPYFPGLFASSILKIIDEYYHSSDLSSLLSLNKELQLVCGALAELFLNENSSFQSTLRARKNKHVIDKNDYSSQISDFEKITQVFSDLYFNILYSPNYFVTHVETARKAINACVDFESKMLPTRAENSCDYIYYATVKEFFQYTLDPFVVRYRTGVPLTLCEVNTFEIELLTLLRFTSYLAPKIEDEKPLVAIENVLDQACYNLSYLEEKELGELKAVIGSVRTLLNRREFAAYAVFVLIKSFEQHGFLIALFNSYNPDVAIKLCDEIQAIKACVSMEETKNLFTPPDAYGKTYERKKLERKGISSSYTCTFPFASGSTTPVTIPSPTYIQVLFRSMLQSKDNYSETENKILDYCKRILILEILKDKKCFDSSSTDELSIKCTPQVYSELQRLIKNPYLFTTIQRDWVIAQCEATVSASLGASSASKLGAGVS